jgi:hypothetical protein
MLWLPTRTQGGDMAQKIKNGKFKFFLKKNHLSDFANQVMKIHHNKKNIVPCSLHSFFKKFNLDLNNHLPQ